MASIAFPKISAKVKLSEGATYGYVHVKPSPSSNKPYILLLHGFPSSSYDWRYQIDFLAKEGYGVLAPDLLGYGDTDKPTEIEAYRGKKMAGETASLLDALGIDVVIGVGHDWSVTYQFQSLHEMLIVSPIGDLAICPSWQTTTQSAS